MAMTEFEKALLAETKRHNEVMEDNLKTIEGHLSYLDHLSKISYNMVDLVAATKFRA